MKKKEISSELTSKGSTEDTLLLQQNANHNFPDMERETTESINLDRIQSRILQMRGFQVIIDRDLAEFYGVETKRLNEAVKRNIKRFPERYRFQLSKDELSEVVANCDHLTSLKFSPVPHFVFTEEGVAQLSSVLKSDRAIDVSIMIMDAFVAMRRFLTANAGLFQRIEHLEEHQHLTDQKVEKVLQRMEELAPSISPEQLFPNGCVWDAYSYVSSLIRSAKEQVILIDNYVDETVLTLLDKRADGVKAVIHSRFSEGFLRELERHNAQYPPVEFVQFPHKVHDRFLIIDSQVYLLGNSLKDMGHTLSAAILTGFSVDEVLGKLR